MVEFDADAADAIEGQGGKIILRVVSGSRAHGLATEHSDTDTRGVCIPGPRHLLGLDPFEQWESADNDHVIFGVTKFFRLALQGNPNIMETLYTADEHVLVLDPDLGQPLIDARDLFLSKQVGERFVRYAVDQLSRMQRHHRWLQSPPGHEPTASEYGAVHVDGRWVFPDSDAQKAHRAALKHYRHYERWRAGRNRERAKLETAYGYDTKHASHLCRLLKMGREILTEGRVIVKRPDREWLLGIRGGAWAYDELVEWAQAEIDALPALTAGSELPDEPERAAAEALLVELKLRFLERARH